MREHHPIFPIHSLYIYKTSLQPRGETTNRLDLDNIQTLGNQTLLLERLTEVLEGFAPQMTIQGLGVFVSA